MDYKITATTNLVWITVGQIITRGLGAIFFFYLAFKLGDASVGVFSFIFSFLGLWFIFGELGLFQYLTRKWSRDESNWQNDFSLAFYLKIFTSTLILIFLIIYLIFFDRQIWLELILVFVALFLDQIRALQETYFNSQNRFKVSSSAILIERIIEVTFGILLLYLGLGLKPILIVYIIGRIIAIIYQRTKEKFIYFSGIKLKNAMSLIKGSLPFLFIGIFTTIYFRIDTIMLKFLQGFEVVGWYSAAYRFIDLLAVLPGIFIIATFPIFTKIFKEGKKEEYLNLFKKTFKYLFIIAVPVLVIGIFLAGDIINLFYTQSFEPATLALQILLIATFLIFINYLFLSLLSAQNQEKIVMKITGIAAIINIILNFILIPKFSLYGAAAATVITEAINLFAATRFLKLKPAYDELLKIIAAVIPVVLFLLLFKELNFIILGLISLIIYTAFILFFRVINKNEINFYFNLVKEKFS